MVFQRNTRASSENSWTAGDFKMHILFEFSAAKMGKVSVELAVMLILHDSCRRSTPNSLSRKILSLFVALYGRVPEYYFPASLLVQIPSDIGAGPHSMGRFSDQPVCILQGSSNEGALGAETVCRISAIPITATTRPGKPNLKHSKWSPKSPRW